MKKPMSEVFSFEAQMQNECVDNAIGSNKIKHVHEHACILTRAL